MENNIKNTNLIPPSPQINIETLRPFTRFCVTIGALPTSYMLSLSYEEQLLWFCKFLQDTVIPALNNNGEAVAELQALYVELKNYVDNYFKNLDVQEEINNKLDEMAESGELQEIITSYLKINGILGFNTVNDMKNSNYIIDGSFAKTYGKNSYNDGLGEFYKIRNITNEDVIDEVNIIKINGSDILIAELIKNATIEQLKNDMLELQNTVNNLSNSIENYLTNSSFDTLTLNRMSRNLILKNQNNVQMQGIKFIDENTVIQALVNSQVQYSNAGVLQKVNIKTMATQNSLNLDDIGHANYIDVNTSKNEIYITMLNHYVSNIQTPINRIIVVDLNNFTFKKNIDLDLPNNENAISFIYDTITQKYYVFTTNFKLYSYNYEQNTLTLIRTLTKITNYQILQQYSQYTIQNATIYNDHIYISYMNPYGVAVYNVNSNDLIRFYNYPIQTDELYDIREVEQLTIINDNIFVGSTGEEAVDGEYQILQYFKGNITTGTGDLLPHFKHPTRRSVYIDINSTSINPNGDEENPFKTIGEALDILYSRTFKNLDIIVKTGTYPYVYINQPGCDIAIYQATGESSKPIIRGMKINSTKVTLRNLHLNKSYRTSDAPLVLSGADTIQRGLNFVANSGETLIDSSRSRLNIAYMTVNGDNFDCNEAVYYISLELSSELLFNDDICPIISNSDGSCNVLKPVKFTGDYRIYNGTVQYPTAFFTMLASGIFKRIICEITITGTNNNIFEEFAFNDASDEFNLKTHNLNATQHYLQSATLDYDENTSLVMKNNYMWDYSGSINTKSDNNSQTNYIALMNLYFAN